MKRAFVTGGSGFLGGRLAHEVTVDDSKARTELGYAPRVTIEAGLAEMRGGTNGA